VGCQGTCARHVSRRVIPASRSLERKISERFQRSGPHFGRCHRLAAGAAAPNAMAFDFFEKYQFLTPNKERDVNRRSKAPRSAGGYLLFSNSPSQEVLPIR
jgi:hypothetical protein